jgi:metal-responsive CopG/Arc/MetJ family transcriptional regulator
MTSKRKEIERLQVELPLEELKAIEDFRFRHRMPSRSAAVRELLRRGLAASESQPATVRRIESSKKSLITPDPQDMLSNSHEPIGVERTSC